MQIQVHSAGFVPNLEGVRGCYRLRFSLPEIPTDWPKRPELMYETAGIPANYAPGVHGITVDATITHPATGHTYTRPCYWHVPSAAEAAYGKRGFWVMLLSPKYSGAWTYTISGQSSEFPVPEEANEAFGGGGGGVGMPVGGEVFGQVTVGPTRIHPGPFGPGSLTHINLARRDPRFYYRELDDQPLIQTPGINHPYIYPDDLDPKWDGLVSISRGWFMGDQAGIAPFDIGGQGGASNFSNEYRPYAVGGDGINPETATAIFAWRSDGSGNRTQVKCQKYEYSNGTTKKFRIVLTVRADSLVRQDVGQPYGVGLQLEGWLPPQWLINPDNTITPIGTWVTIDRTVDVVSVAQSGYFGFSSSLFLSLFNCTDASSGVMLRCSIREVDGSGNFLSGEIALDEWVSTDVRPSVSRSKAVDDIIFAQTQRGRCVRFMWNTRQSGINSFRTSTGLLDVTRIPTWNSHQETIIYDVAGGTVATNWFHYRFRNNIRYLVARWGWCPAIYSWEYCNECNPDEPLVYQAANEIAAYFEEFETEPEREVGNTVSFYHSIKATWNNYPRLTQGDWHCNIDRYHGGEDSLNNPGSTHPYADIPGLGYVRYFPSVYHDATEDSVSVFDNTVVGSGAERNTRFYYSRRFGVTLTDSTRLRLNFRYKVENGATAPVAGNLFAFVAVYGTLPAQHPWGNNDGGEQRKYLGVDPNLSDGLWHTYTWTNGFLRFPTGGKGGFADIFFDWTVAAKLHIGRVWFTNIDTGQEIDVHRHDSATGTNFAETWPPNEVRHFTDELVATFGTNRSIRDPLGGRQVTLGEYNPRFYYADEDPSATDPYLEYEYFHLMLTACCYPLIWQPTWPNNKIAGWGPRILALKNLLLRPEMKWGYGNWRDIGNQKWDRTKVSVTGQVNATDKRAILMVSPISFGANTLKSARLNAYALGQDIYGDSIGSVAPVTGTIPIPMPNGTYSVARRRMKDCSLIASPTTVVVAGGVLDVPYTNLSVWELFDIYESAPATTGGSAQGSTTTTARIVNAASVCGTPQGGCKLIETLDPVSIPSNTWRVYKGGVLVATGNMNTVSNHWTVTDYVRQNKENVAIDIPTHNLDGVFVMPPMDAEIGDDYEVWWSDFLNPVGQEGRRGAFKVIAGSGNPKVMQGVIRGIPLSGQVLVGTPFVNTWWIEDSIGNVVTFNTVFGPTNWFSQDAYVGVHTDAYIQADSDTTLAAGLVWKCFRGYIPATSIPYSGWAFSAFDLVAYDPTPDCMDVTPPPPPDPEEMWDERCFDEADSNRRCPATTLAVSRVPGLRDSST